MDMNRGTQIDGHKQMDANIVVMDGFEQIDSNNGFLMDTNGLFTWVVSIISRAYELPLTWNLER